MQQHQYPAGRSSEYNARKRNERRWRYRACLLFLCITVFGLVVFRSLNQLSEQSLSGNNALKKDDTARMIDQNRYDETKETETPLHEEQSGDGDGLDVGVFGNVSDGVGVGEDDVNRGVDDHIGDWNLILVNPWNNIPDGYEIDLKQLKNGHAVDRRCYTDLQDMMDSCRAAGLTPLICSSYRSGEKQERLFYNKVDSFTAKGCSMAEAWDEAGKIVAVPGTSEHQLGLAVDIVDINNQNLNSSQEKTDVQQWLMQNSWKYGFILRYPSNKSDITGIAYEPWHYRYVGKKAARYIYEKGICLEEYLQILKT